MTLLDCDQLIALVLKFRLMLEDADQSIAAKVILDTDPALERQADEAARHVIRKLQWPPIDQAALKSLLFWRCQYGIEALEDARPKIAPMTPQFAVSWLEELLTECWAKEGRSWFVSKFAPRFRREL